MKGKAWFSLSLLAARRHSFIRYRLLHLLPARVLVLFSAPPSARAALCLFFRQPLIDWSHSCVCCQLGLKRREVESLTELTFEHIIPLSLTLSYITHNIISYNDFSQTGKLPVIMFSSPLTLCYLYGCPGQQSLFSYQHYLSPHWFTHTLVPFKLASQLHPRYRYPPNGSPSSIFFCPSADYAIFPRF